MSLTFTIRVVPGSSLQKASIDKAGTLKVYLNSQPEYGKANKELVQFLSKKLGVPQLSIVLVSGENARKKTLRIEADITLAKLHGLLDIVIQATLL